MIQVWIKGECKEETGRGGAGIVIVLPDSTTGRLGRPLGQTTSSRAELLAVQIALDMLAACAQEPITFYTGSQDVVDWLTSPFRIPAEASLVIDLRHCLSAFSFVTFAKVHNPCSDPLSEEIAQLARHAAAGVSIDEWSRSSRKIAVTTRLALELEALLARLRQLRSPLFAVAETHLASALAILHQQRTPEQQRRVSLHEA